MLPFLKKDKEASVAVPAGAVKRDPDDGSEYDDESEYDPLESAAQDLISAVHSKDTEGACLALRAAYDLLGSEPNQGGSV